MRIGSATDAHRQRQVESLDGGNSAQFSSRVLRSGRVVEGRSSATARRRASDYIRYDQWYISHGNTCYKNKIKTCRSGSRFFGWAFIIRLTAAHHHRGDDFEIPFPDTWPARPTRQYRVQR